MRERRSPITLRLHPGYGAAIWRKFMTPHAAHQMTGALVRGLTRDRSNLPRLERSRLRKRVYARLQRAKAETSAEALRIALALALVALVALVALGAGPLAAQPIDQAFAGKTIT